MKFLISLLAIAILFPLARFILSRLRISNEYQRKIIHLGVGLVFFILPYFVSRIEILFICAIFFLALLLSRFHNFLPGVHGVNRKTWGEFYYPISIALTAWFFLPQNILAFQFGILILGISDAFAEIIGKAYGRHKIKIVSKSWEGASAFFVTALIIFFALIYPSHPGTALMGVGIVSVLTLVEVLLVFGLDNLLLPILAAFLINLII
jgi:phytol kinase